MKKQGTPVRLASPPMLMPQRSRLPDPRDPLYELRVAASPCVEEPVGLLSLATRGYRAWYVSDGVFTCGNNAPAQLDLPTRIHHIFLVQKTGTRMLRLLYLCNLWHPPIVLQSAVEGQFCRVRDHRLCTPMTPNLARKK